MELRSTQVINLEPYSSAREIYKKGIFFDANENFTQWVKINYEKINNLNRYPDSQSYRVREKIAEKIVKDFSVHNIFFGSGSDEIIDLLIRGFVNQDEAIMVMTPSYSIYEVQGIINGKKIIKIKLNPDFSLNIYKIKRKIEGIKLIFLCSPNNPTGNLINKSEIEAILSFFQGLLVIDEAYIEYAGMENSFINILKKHKNVVILRTFSKAWGLAGIRAGYCIAHNLIIETLLKIKNSYNVSILTQEIVLQALDQINLLDQTLLKTKRNKINLENSLKRLGLKTIPTETNFILALVKDSTKVYKDLAKEGLIVRNRSNLPYLRNALRITIGSSIENKKLLAYFKKKYEKK